MRPELNCEYPEPGEAKLIVEMVRLAVERMEPRQGHMRRNQHAKATGCVRGVYLGEESSEEHVLVLPTML